jgi:hypothetical protein
LVPGHHAQVFINQRETLVNQVQACLQGCVSLLVAGVGSWVGLWVGFHRWILGVRGRLAPGCNHSSHLRRIVENIFVDDP